MRATLDGSKYHILAFDRQNNCLLWSCLGYPKTSPQASTQKDLGWKVRMCEAGPHLSIKFS
jgi:hypothetical protein